MNTASRSLRQGHDKEQAENSSDNEMATKIEWSADDGESLTTSFGSNQPRKRRRRAGIASTGVGVKDTRPKKRKRRRPEYTGESTDLSDNALEQNQPDYLKSRRQEFQAAHERLNIAGLRLPPRYDDIDFSDNERIRSLKRKPVFPQVIPPRPYKDIELEYSAGIIPAPIAQWLKPYQVDGVSFLHELFVYQKGGILGDDMGLGKTIQVIAALTAAFGKSGDERDAKRMRKKRRANGKSWYPRVLIVCPGSLIANWKSELDAWGWWSVDVFLGSDADKDAALAAAKSGHLEIMMTTYHTYRMSAELINEVQWDCCIADECHQIRERKSLGTIAMNEVNALCRIGLTGTAIQNKYDELWTLLNWTNPGRLGPISVWRRTIGEPLKVGQSHDATQAELAKARKTARRLRDNLLPEFFLRRMKTLIAHQLPKKSDRVVFCPLTEVQAAAYQRFIDSDIVQLIQTATQECNCGSGKRRGWCHGDRVESTSEAWQQYVFPSMQTLRNISNHIGLLIPSGTDRDKVDRDLQVLQTCMPHNWKDLYEGRENIVTLSDREMCGKWRVLSKLLQFWHSSGDKVLVFSHSVRLLRLLQMLFQKTSYNVSYLDGSMSYEERAKTVADFNSDPHQFVFLISTRAGGVGLNITSANKVVVVDPNWNPSYDLQAQDRAYRIGQTRDVEVFRLVSTGTIEECVYARQIYKQQQANIGYNASSERRYFSGVQEMPNRKGEIFGLANLFAFQGNNIVLRDIVNKTNVAESRAGVAVVDFEVEAEDEDYATVPKAEDAAMNQLAEWIKSKDTRGANAWPEEAKKAKLDPISAILAGAGVEYTHDNNEIVGTSAVEQRLSRMAEAGVPSNDAVFAAIASDSDSQDLDAGAVQIQSVAGGPSFATDAAAEPSASAVPRGVPRYRHRPPDDVRKRQLCSMAAFYGWVDEDEPDAKKRGDDLLMFALSIEKTSVQSRRLLLENFYASVRRGEVPLAA